MAQGRDQSAMAAHGVAKDAAQGAGRKVLLDQRGQLQGHIVLHPVVRSPGGLRGVDIKTRTLAQVVGRVVGHRIAAWAGVRCNHDDTMARRMRLSAGLGDEVLLGAGQPGQPVKHRACLAARCGFGQIHRQLHLATECC